MNRSEGIADFSFYDVFMMEVNLLDNLFIEYGYTLQESNESCRVYLLRQGMYYGAEIVIFDDSDQKNLFNEYSKAGFSVKRQRFKTIDEVEEYLFKGFFKTDVSRHEIKKRYQAFAEKQVRPYGVNSGIKYQYIQMPFTVSKDSLDEGMQGHDLLNTIFHQIETPGAHLVIVEAAAGYGKTCTSYELYKTFLDRESSRSIKPIFTELSRNRDVKKFKYVLWSEIDNEKSTTAKQSLVVYNIKKGRIPLIIDGFDELLSKDIDSGSEEGLDEFEQVETMLSTIGGLLQNEAKIILTSRKTAIFAGAQFEEWVDSYKGSFDVIRIQLEKPDIRTWLSVERYESLVNAKVPLAHVANPVLLTYLRNISEEDFKQVLTKPCDITSKYFEFLLTREKTRQNIIIPASDQQVIYENLAKTFLEFDIMGESRQFVKEMIVDYNKPLLLKYKELSPDNPTLNELADTMTNHALLDRVGNKDYVTFVNEYIFGYLLGNALINNNCDFLAKQIPYPEEILERAISSFKYSSEEDKAELWSRLIPFRNKMNNQHALYVDSVLKQRIYGSFISCGFNSMIYEDVSFLENDGSFSNVSFVDCTFENCVFCPSVFNNTFFTGCKFLNCTLVNELSLLSEESVHFYGCEDYHSGFIAQFNKKNKVVVRQEVEATLEIQILSKYFKVDGRSTKMKYISYIKREFPEKILEEVFSVFNSLKKKNYIQVRGNNSFITQLGINYYHKHSI